jgi:N-acyl amino acid synthase of PEP-CTERM/exosortase system
MHATARAVTPVSVETVPDPGERFRQYFEIVPGVTDQIRDDVYQIRHEVYCEDLRFEPLRSDRREVDEYDSHSLHCLMRRSDASRDLVGCTRLVLAQVDGVDYELPFERVCERAIDRSVLDPARLARHEIAEVSRLAVRARYRQRRHEAQLPISLATEDFGTAAQPRFPHIPVGLYLGSMAIARRAGIKLLFVLTEPRLAQHFSRLGVHIRPIGTPVEHRGERLPSVMCIDEIIDGLRRTVRPVWDAINEQIDAYLDEHSADGRPGHARHKVVEPTHRWLPARMTRSAWPAGGRDTGYGARGTG